MRLAVVLVLATACAGKVPETRYYSLAAPSGPQSADEGVTLAIAPLEVDPAYDDERIVYRLTPYRLDYYNYHRWSATPGALVADYLERSLQHSGRFKAVTRSEDAAPVTLGGRVVAIEEVDHSKTSWVGRIAVELTLTEVASGKVIWSRQFEEQQPLRAQTPEGLAEALTVALSRITDKALPQIADVATQTARAGEGATPTGRAARLAR